MGTIILTLFILSSTTAHADGLRQSILLDKGWRYRPISDPNLTVKDTEVTLPHTWNANYTPGTTHYNRETMVYSRDINVTDAMRGKRLFLYFEGVNSVADVFINRRTAGSHHGGYTAFCIEITDMVHPGVNDLQVWVSNAFRTDVLPLAGDFNVYGGIHRPCHLLVTDADCITPLFYGSSGVMIRQDKVTADKADITVETHLSLSGKHDGMKLRTTVTDAAGKIVVHSETDATGDIVNQPMTISPPHPVARTQESIYV